MVDRSLVYFNKNYCENLNNSQFRFLSNLNSLIELDVNNYKKIIIIDAEFHDLIAILSKNISFKYFLDKFIIISKNLSARDIRKLLSFGINQIYVLPTDRQFIKDILDSLSLNNNAISDHIYLDDQSNLLINEYKVSLTEKENEILTILMQSKRPMEISDIAKIVTDKESQLKTEESIRITIHRLKKKIFEQSGYKPISNKYGKGYFVKYSISS